MAWLKIHTNITRNPKTRRFARALKVKNAQAVGHLITLWTTVLEVCEDGDLTKYTNQGIADLADWDGDCDKFFEALKESQWLDVRGEYKSRVVYIHDWLQHIERYMQAKHWRDREKWAKLRATLQQRSAFIPHPIEDTESPAQSLPYQKNVKKPGKPAATIGDNAFTGEGQTHSLPLYTPEIQPTPQSISDSSLLSPSTNTPTNAVTPRIKRKKIETEIELFQENNLQEDSATEQQLTADVGREAQSAFTQKVDANTYENVGEKSGTSFRDVQTQQNPDAVRVRGEEIKDKKKIKKAANAAVFVKAKHLECVFLTNDELAKLRVLYSLNFEHVLDKNGDERLQYGIQKLNDYIMARNKTRTYKSHYHVLRGWVLQAVHDDEKKGRLRFKPNLVKKFRTDITFCPDCDAMLTFDQWNKHDCQHKNADTREESVLEALNRLKTELRNAPQSTGDASASPELP